VETPACLRRENVSDDMYGYDYEPPKSSGDYLRLTQKGQSIRVRLVSPPLIFEEEFQQSENSAPKKVTRAAWVVILKEAGEDNKIIRTVKHYKAGMMVYGAIVDLVKDRDWGNPQNYDIVITRTEEKGKYYTVLPKPNGKPLTDEERAMVEAAGFDLKALYTQPRTNGHGGSHRDETDDPFADE
jgi:hypothetical protein